MLLKKRLLFCCVISCLVFINCSNPTNDKLDISVKSPKTYFSVEHWLQNVDRNDYELQYLDCLHIESNPGNLTTVSANLYPGFTPLPFDQVVVSEDNSTVVKILYDRIEVSVVFNIDGEKTEQKGFYGSPLVAPDVKSETGKLFTGWTNSFKDIFPSENTEYSARFVEIAKDGINLDSKPYEKTGEVVIIPLGETKIIDMSDDSSWNTYYEGTDSVHKGVFVKNRKVELSPYIMGQYEVTQELYRAVMSPDTYSEASPSYHNWNPVEGEKQDLRPVEKITWFDAVYFCNKLSEKCGLTPVYTITAIERDDTKNIKNATVIVDMTKNGYRLPTEAEWEFAARGGDTTSEEWGYAFSGNQSEFLNCKYFAMMRYNLGLYSHAWNCNIQYDERYESDERYDASYETNRDTHEVGLKKMNILGLYDMSGNVSEYCYDVFDFNPTFNDLYYLENGKIKNPLGRIYGTNRVVRGGSYADNSWKNSVSYREAVPQDGRNWDRGFRLVRNVQ